MTEPTDPPNLAYYRRNEGGWACTLDFEVRDWSAWWSARMSWMDRAQVVAMHVVCGHTRLIRMQTTVDCSTSAQGHVRHTTRLRMWGLELFRSTEFFDLHEDGLRLGVRGERWTWPGLRSDFVGSSGEVSPDGRSASYRFPWFGAELTQRTRIVEGGCDIEQSTGWGGGVQELRAA